MIYHQLGRSNLKVSAIGFGCMSLGLDQATNNELITLAIDGGINFFDTADLYQKGENERTLGIAIRNKRQDLVIATKVGNQWRSDGTGPDWNPTKKYILAEVENSLRRLQTDYIDLYQLHGGMITDPIDETISAFELLLQQGKIRHYGISSIRPNVIRQWLNKSRVVSVMMQYSLLDRRAEEACLQLLADHSVSLLARGVLAQGLLIDKPAKTYLGLIPEQVNAVAKAIERLSSESRSKVQTAVKYVLQNSSLGSVIAGIRTREQLKELIATFDSPDLSSIETEILNNSSIPLFYKDHR